MVGIVPLVPRMASFGAEIMSSRVLVVSVINWNWFSQIRLVEMKIGCLYYKLVVRMLMLSLKFEEVFKGK